MSELLSASTAWVNAPYTFALILVLLYWLSLIIGLVDIESFDWEVDGGSDVDAAGVGKVLGFFNIGEVPFMIWVSIAVLGMWITSVLTNDFLGNESLLVAAVILLPNLIVNSFVAKIVTTPLRRFFRELESDALESVDVVGSLARVKSGSVDSQFGQAEVPWEGADLVINVRTRGDETLRRGDEVMVIEYLSDDDTYIVTGIETEARP